jgi:hypothetical protein
MGWLVWCVHLMRYVQVEITVRYVQSILERMAGLRPRSSVSASQVIQDPTVVYASHALLANTVREEHPPNVQTMQTLRLEVTKRVTAAVNQDTSETRLTSPMPPGVPYVPKTLFVQVATNTKLAVIQTPVRESGVTHPSTVSVWRGGSAIVVVSVTNALWGRGVLGGLRRYVPTTRLPWGVAQPIFRHANVSLGTPGHSTALAKSVLLGTTKALLDRYHVQRVVQIHTPRPKLQRQWVRAFLALRTRHLRYIATHSILAAVTQATMVPAVSIVPSAVLEHIKLIQVIMSVLPVTQGLTHRL